MDVAFTDDELTTLACALGDAVTYLLDHSESDESAWVERYQALEARIDEIRLRA